MSFDPREIPNNFRMQPLVDQGIVAAEELLQTKSEEDLSLDELVNLSLIYMEIGNWSNVKKYADRVLAVEASNTSLINENKATALYASATGEREFNLCKEAEEHFLAAQTLTQSDWLKSNILRNLGLVYLKLQKFSESHQYFQQAYELVSDSTDLKLRGSLPALSNYMALTLGRTVLASGDNPGICIQLFDETSHLYDTLFTEKGISDEVIRRRSNDYISHCTHRGMIICEISEKYPSEDHNANLLAAENILLEALKSRKENKADGQRLGDVCIWLGRVYERLHRIEEAKQSYYDALEHYRKVFTSEEAKQIVDTKSRLTNLSFKNVSIESLVLNSALKPKSSEDLVAETKEQLTSSANADNTIITPTLGMSNVV